MTEVSMNKNMKLSEHLASPSEAALSHSSKLDGLIGSRICDILTTSYIKVRLLSLPKHRGRRRG